MGKLNEKSKVSDLRCGDSILWDDGKIHPITNIESFTLPNGKVLYILTSTNKDFPKISHKSDFYERIIRCKRQKIQARDIVYGDKIRFSDGLFHTVSEIEFELNGTALKFIFRCFEGDKKLERSFYEKGKVECQKKDSFK